MKLWNLIKTEFIKNSQLLKFLIILFVLIMTSLIIIKYSTYEPQNNVLDITYYVNSLEQEKNDLAFIYETDPNFINEYNLKKTIFELEKFQKIKEDNLDQDGWQYFLLQEVTASKIRLMIYEKYQEDPSNPELFGFQDVLSLIDLEHIDLVVANKKEQITKMENIYASNKYYEYVEYCNEEDQSSSSFVKDLNQYIIDNKIEDAGDWRVNVIQRLKQVYSSYNRQLVSEERFNPQVSYFDIQVNSYDEYVELFYKEQDKNKQLIEIFTYALEQNIPPDTSGDYIIGDTLVLNSKTVLNNGFYLGIVAVCIVIITSSGIVASEHHHGSIKLLLTTPNKRWKVLLSKFLYLILYTFLLYILGYIILTIFTIFKFGIQDIFVPKLLYHGGKVIEVNYILWLIKNIFLHMLPIIAILSILFFLSAITLNVAITSSITTIITIISFIAWYLIYIYRLTFLCYTPIPYLSYGDVINQTEYFKNSMMITNSSLSLGLLVSIVCILLFYLGTNFIYLKRDIKN